ncbi:MAG: hypothetical protein AAF721_39435 [Myxococcota bacterium]
MITTTLPSLLALVVAGSPEAAPVAHAGLGRATPFVRHAFELGGMWPGPTPDARTAFGIDVEAGAELQPRRRLRLSLSGSLAPAGIARSERPGFAGATTDVSGKFRVGVTGERVWAYAVLRAGATIVTVGRGDAFSRDAGVTAGAGLGFLYALNGRMSLGSEALATVTWLPPRGGFLRITGGLMTFQIRFAGRTGRAE